MGEGDMAVGDGVAVAIGKGVGLGTDVAVAGIGSASRVEMTAAATALSNALFDSAVCSIEIRTVASMSAVADG